jgi:8-oxo-dGTP pyrophosphatase MutT (NUDIX family)
MKIDSAGILFICGDRCLLTHATNSRSIGSWMPPKGHVESGESIEQAAIRETEEEIGWSIRGAFLKDYFDVVYTDRKGSIYKTVRCYTVKIESEDPDQNGPMLKKTSGLQLEEVDRISWVHYRDIGKMALPRWVNQLETEMRKHQLN